MFHTNTKLSPKSKLPTNKKQVFAYLGHLFEYVTNKAMLRSFVVIISKMVIFNKQNVFDLLKDN